MAILTDHRGSMESHHVRRAERSRRRSQRGWRLAALVPVALGLVLLAGCQRAPGSLEVVDRFLDAPIQDPFRPIDLVSGEPLFDWRLRGLGIGADWGSRQETYTLEVEGVATQISMEGNQLHIERAVDWQAAEVDRLEIVLANRREGSSFTGNLSFLWAGPGETLDGSRGVQVPAGEPVDGGLRLYQMVLRQEPAWQGQITRIRIVCAIAEKAQIAVRRVTGYHDQVGAEQLMALHQQGVKASLGEQARDALLALPGVPVEHLIEVPTDAELRFAYGAQEGVGQRVDLAVEVVVGENQTKTLWSQSLEVPTEDADDPVLGRWYLESIDLGALAGQSVTLRLVTTADEVLDPRQGFALWGHPEVLAPRDRAKP